MGDRDAANLPLALFRIVMSVAALAVVGRWMIRALQGRPAEDDPARGGIVFGVVMVGLAISMLLGRRRGP